MAGAPRLPAASIMRPINSIARARIFASGLVTLKRCSSQPAPVPAAARANLLSASTCFNVGSVKTSGDGAKISTASKPRRAALAQEPAKSPQKTKGPPFASGTREMVTLDRIIKEPRDEQERTAQN